MFLRSAAKAKRKAALDAMQARVKSRRTGTQTREDEGESESETEETSQSDSTAESDTDASSSSSENESDPPLPFGKFKGMRLSHVPSWYTRWCAGYYLGENGSRRELDKHGLGEIVRDFKEAGLMAGRFKREEVKEMLIDNDVFPPYGDKYGSACNRVVLTFAQTQSRPLPLRLEKPSRCRTART